MLPVGDAGLLVEVDGLPEVLALADAVRAAPPAGVLDVVPAARTVLLVLAPGTDLGATRRAVLELPVEPGAGAGDGEVVQIDVVYDGPDLDEVARLTGLGADGVVAGAHRRPVAGGLRRLRPRFRLPGRRRRPAGRGPPGRAAHHRPGRVGRAGR